MGRLVAAALGVLVAATLSLVILGSGTTGASEGFGASQEALADIPADYLPHYQEAGEKYGIDWAVLAAIGKIESDHGRGPGPGIRSGVNSYGCCAGPMQFYISPFSGRIPARSKNSSTWGQYGVDANSDGWKDVYDPADAIHAAGNYLHALGGKKDIRKAIYGYNHAWWYVEKVLAQAEKYRGEARGTPDAGGGGGGDWLWPTTVKTISSSFGMRWGRLHAGIDIPAPHGAPIWASKPGTVTYASWMSGYGNYTCVRHASSPVRIESCYAHQSRIGVRVGQLVARGRTIGRIGNTGHSFGAHLHFEIRKGGEPVDPQPYLK